MEPLLDYNGAFARSLLGAAAVASNSTIDSSYLGSYHDMRAAMGINWFAFSVCVVSLLYYAFHYSKSMTGWEEVYVCVIECEFFCCTVLSCITHPAPTDFEHVLFELTLFPLQWPR